MRTNIFPLDQELGLYETKVRLGFALKSEIRKSIIKELLSTIRFGNL